MVAKGKKLVALGKKPKALQWRIAVFFGTIVISSLLICIQLLNVPTLDANETIRAGPSEKRLQALAEAARVHSDVPLSALEQRAQDSEQNFEDEKRLRLAIEQRLAFSANHEKRPAGLSLGSVSGQTDAPHPRSVVSELGDMAKDMAFATRVVPDSIPSASDLSRFTTSDGGSLLPMRIGEPITEPQLRTMAAAGSIAVVVVVCRRPKYLARTMESILQAARDPMKFPIIVSQDGEDQAMYHHVHGMYVKKGLAFHMRHGHADIPNEIANKYQGSMNAGYMFIAQHFGFAMRKTFDDFGFEQAIFIEEDLDVSPDFFSFFGAMSSILRADRDLYCVSAWNDNGAADLVMDPRAVFRTDIFPGLGWMTTRSFWQEVRTRWCESYWDEFMRRPDVRKGRHCLRPDVSRSFTFGQDGTSQGQFFDRLNRIKLNKVNVDWSKVDTRDVSSVVAFEAYLLRHLQSAVATNVGEIKTLAQGLQPSQHKLRVMYRRSEYTSIARFFGLMDDTKEGSPRMAYRGVIPFAWQGFRIFLHTDAWPLGMR